MSALLPKKRIQLIALALVVCGAFAAGALAGTRTEDPVTGTFTVLDRDSDYLIAAPHGDFDTQTDAIVYGFCERVRWNCLVATDFETEGPRINVNRPTEGHKRSDTAFSERAARVFEAYMARVHSLNPRLKLYVEIHGNNHPELRDTIEVATVGISRDQAVAVEAILADALDQHGLGRLTPKLDVLQDVHYAATHNREFGALSLIRPALHIELPEEVRERERAQIIAALAEALPQVIERQDREPQFASL